jgi:hypothetical protein
VETLSKTTAPRRIETSLLVLEQFRVPGGTEWRPGDRAPLEARKCRPTMRQSSTVPAPSFRSTTIERRSPVSAPRGGTCTPGGSGGGSKTG